MAESTRSAPGEALRAGCPSAKMCIDEFLNRVMINTQEWKHFRNPTSDFSIGT